MFKREVGAGDQWVTKGGAAGATGPKGGTRWYGQPPEEVEGALESNGLHCFRFRGNSQKSQYSFPNVTAAAAKMNQNNNTAATVKLQQQQFSSR